MRICVYGAASPNIDAEYITKVEELGREMAKRGHSLVFGGGKNGLMGAVARGVHENGGETLGVMPGFFIEQSAEVLYEHCDKFIKTETMRERKQIMEENADAFIVVPGGIGTYEEFFEILTSKQLLRHNKPIAIYNVSGFYNELGSALKNAIKKNFVKKQCLDLFRMSEELSEIFKYIEAPTDEAKTIKDLKEG